MIWFIFGTLFGIAFMCLFQVERSNDDVKYWKNSYHSAVSEKMIYKRIVDKQGEEIAALKEMLEERGDSNGKQRD